MISVRWRSGLRAGSQQYVRRFVLATALVAATFAAWLPMPAVGAEYLLGPQDRVRLKIYEWRPSRDSIFEWTALNDEFSVSADGSLFLPFVGEVRAEGLTPGEISTDIVARLVGRMGLGHPPDVAVEVVQFRPFYIVGHVTQPGEFPYRPGLTVLQAVSIAGGLRTREDEIGRLEREVIAGRGELSLITLSDLTLRARKARLQAELQDAEEIAFPPVLLDRQHDSAVATMLEQERTVFETRQEGLRTQLRALQELRDTLDKELGSLEQQLTFHDSQIEITRKELSGVTSLVDQGLAVAPRQMSLERSLLQMQSERLSAATGLLRARQELSRTDISMLELRNRHVAEVASSLRDTETQLGEIERRADTTVQLLEESERAAPRLLAMRERAARAEPTYTIVRTSEGRAIELAAEESTAVLPGDTVKVEIPFAPGVETPLSTGVEMSQSDGAAAPQPAALALPPSVAEMPLVPGDDFQSAISRRPQGPPPVTASSRTAPSPEPRPEAAPAP